MEENEIRIVKEFCPWDAEFRIIVRVGDNYCKTLAMVNRLYAEAKKDFSDLEPEAIEVVIYGGDTIKKMMGIEFDSKVAPPPEYDELYQIHLSLA